MDLLSRQFYPEGLLLSSVRENNEDNVIHILKRKPKLISYNYKVFGGKTIFAIACDDFAQSVFGETVRLLVNFGAHKVVSSNPDRYEAIHFAVLGSSPVVIKAVIKSGCNVNATTATGDTALHILFRNKYSKSLLECAEILLSNGIDLNIVNNKLQSALYLAVSQRYLDLVKLLLKHRIVDVDTCVKQYVKCKCCWVEATPAPVRCLIEGLNISTANVARCNVNNELCHCLSVGDEEGFLKNVAGLDVIYYYNYFVKVACVHNYRKVVQYFLDRGVDPKLKSMQHIQTPSNVAAKYGLHEALQFTINHQYIQNKKEILFDIFTPEVLHWQHIPSSDYKKCQDIIIYQTKTNYNVRDRKENYLLKYVTGLEEEKLVSILKGGASLGNRNSDGSLTVAGLSFAVLQRHFDSCIKTSYKSTHYITFFYDTLLPTRCQSNYVTLGGTNFLSSETDVVQYISRQQHLRPLLKHPLLQTFLFVKWRKIKWLFYINLVLYVLFLVLLLYYLFDQSRDDAQMSTVTTSILLFTTVGVACRELTQFSKDPRKHFKSVENIIQLAIIAIVLFMAIKQNIPAEARKQICAFTTVFVSFDVLYLLGNHPVFSTNIAMFRRISLEYAKFLLFFSVPLIGFGLCFYILFRDSPQDSFFADPFNSFFKTMLMLTGEFEAGTIDFAAHPVSSQLLFLLFVFSNAIILMNLLNGLAVSDVQKVVEEAELFGLAATAEYISYLEYLVLGNSFSRKCIAFKERNLIGRYIFKYIAFKICLYPRSTENLKVAVSRERKMFVLNLTLSKWIFREAEAIAQNNKKLKEFVRKETFRKQATLEDVHELASRLKVQLDRQEEELDLLRLDFAEQNRTTQALLHRVLTKLENVEKSFASKYNTF